MASDFSNSVGTGAASRCTAPPNLPMIYTTPSIFSSDKKNNNNLALKVLWIVFAMENSFALSFPGSKLKRHL
jgi:hypothetical protein